MKIVIKAFGPEVTSLLAREKILDMDPSSTIADLVRRLEEEIEGNHGRTVRMLESSFTILVNGSALRTQRGRSLKEGDVVTILSPIGGG